jgi:NAD+ synthase
MIEIPTNTTLLRAILTGFIRNEVHKTGLKRAIVGLSGGVDSALSAMLAAEALGVDNVLAILMPYQTSNPESRAHAELVVQQSGIASLLVEITPQIDTYFAKFPDADARRRGNKMARERMTILYDHSARWNGLVIGTSNKTELLLGYGTLHGDMASAVNPLGDLYKTQVWALAEAIGVPLAIVNKEPSADLWAGQTDEGELGASYSQLDPILKRLNLGADKLIEHGMNPTLVHGTIKRVEKNKHKSEMPPVIKLKKNSRIENVE